MLKSAVAEVEAAELDMQNVKSLTEKKIVSKTKLAMTKAKLEALYAKADEMRSYEASAKLRLAYTEIKAPFDGIIDRLPHKVGSLVDENELLTTLSDNKEVYAYFNVSEKEYLAYSFNKKDKDEAEKITLILADNSLHPYKGTIETIEGEFDKGTGSIAFRARFPNPEGILRHGSSGKVRLKRHVKNALVIPQKATFEIQDKMYVYLLDKSNKVKMQSITIKLRLPHLYVLGSGLNASDRIIYEGIQDIAVGLKIRPEKIDLRQIIPQLAKQ
jgi:membrane fusion protein (multidrug efflux system)